MHINYVNNKQTPTPTTVTTASSSFSKATPEAFPPRALMPADAPDQKNDKAVITAERLQANRMDKRSDSISNAYKNIQKIANAAIIKQNNSLKRIKFDWINIILSFTVILPFLRYYTKKFKIQDNIERINRLKKIADKAIKNSDNTGNKTVEIGNYLANITRLFKKLIKVQEHFEFYSDHYIGAHSKLEYIAANPLIFELFCPSNDKEDKGLDKSQQEKYGNLKTLIHYETKIWDKILRDRF